MRRANKIVSAALALIMTASAAAGSVVVCAEYDAPAVVETDSPVPDETGFIIENGVLTGYTGEGGYVVIPDTLTKIGNEAFKDNTAITSVAVPDSVTDIGNDAFMNCTSLVSVNIGSGVENLDNIYLFGEDPSPFKGSVKLAEINVSDNNPYFCSVNGVLFSKDKSVLIKYPYAKKGSYTIPDGVKEIRAAFFDCTGITAVTIPDSETYIDYYAFSGCTSLKSAKLPAGIEMIRIGIFENCTSLSSVNIPDSVTKIGDSAFSNTALTSVNISQNINEIGYQAFYGCKKLKGFKVSADNTTYKSLDGVLIEEDALVCYPAGKASKKYTIPNEVVAIYPTAFAESSVEEITVHANVDYLEDSFYGAEALKKINIAESNPNYTDIDGVVFSKDGKAILIYPEGHGESYTIPEGVTDIGQNVLCPFINCSKLTNIVIPDSVKIIYDNAFEKCTSLTSVTLPSGLERIGQLVFADCTSLRSVFIPGSVTDMSPISFKDFGASATFMGCTALKDVYYGGSEEAWKKITVDYDLRPNSSESLGLNADCVIHYNYTPDPLADFPLSVNGKGFKTLDEAMKELSKATGDIKIELNDNVSGKKFALPKSASSVTIVGNGFVLTVPSVSASCDLMLQNVTLKTAKGANAAVTAKKALTATNCTLGKTAVTGDAVLESCTVGVLTAKGNLTITGGAFEQITASGKAGTVTTLGGTIVINKALTVSNDLVVTDCADIIVNGKFAPKGTMTFGAIKAFIVKNGK